MLSRNNTGEQLTFYENNTTGIGRAAGGDSSAVRPSVRAAGPASCWHGCQLLPRLCSRLRRSCGPTDFLFSEMADTQAWTRLSADPIALASIPMLDIEGGPAGGVSDRFQTFRG